MRRRILASGIAALTSVAVVPALALTARPHTVAGTHCTSAALAHYAGQVVLDPQPDNRPLVCGGATGFAGAESHVVALPDGTVAYAPAVVPSGFLGVDTPPKPAVASTTQSNASPAGLAITRDGGDHWSFVRPSGVTWNPTDHGDFVDPVTGRLFFEDYGPIPTAPKFGGEQEGPAHINWSADDGRTWHHSAIATVFLPENPRFTAAVAPAGQPEPTGYPNVLYFCANTNVGFTAPAIAGRVCFRSFDGASTWRRGALLFTGTVPQHPECGQSGEQYTAIDGNYPQPTRNGDLYVMVTCGGTTYLARSTDEAATFPIIHVGASALTLPVPSGSGADFRIGPDDAFYVMYRVGQSLLLRVSSDLGRTWSRAFDAVAPGVTSVSQWAFASGGTGVVAVSYLGRRTGQSTWDGYLTETVDASAALGSGPGPVFYSGQINAGDRPLLYGNGVKGAGYIGLPKDRNVLCPLPFNDHSTGNDFIGATVAANDDPWGSFTQDCGPTPNAPGCTATNDQTRGYFGTFRWPPQLPHTG